MAFYKPSTVNELCRFLNANQNKYYLLAGGTDINVQRKNKMITFEDIFFINHLVELKGIEETKDFIKFGCLTTFYDLLKSSLIKNKLSYLHNALLSFASPVLQTMATIGGNLGNSSPTADVIPLLLVLDAKLELQSIEGSRLVELKDFYTSYKQSIMGNNEFIRSICIPFNGQFIYNDTFYKKVGARNSLTIAKVALAGLIKKDGDEIKKIRLAVGSVNEYARRLFKMEKYLAGINIHRISDLKLDFILRNEITPISDLRSDKEYRYQVCENLLKTFLKKL